MKIRFLIAGSAGFSIYYCVALLLTTFSQLGAGAAALGGMASAVLPTFLIQRSFTFRHTGSAWASFPRYVAGQIATTVGVVGAAHICANAGIPAWAGYGVAGGFGVAVSYLIQLTLVFPSSSVKASVGINSQYNVFAPGSIADRVSRFMRRRMFSAFVEGGVLIDQTVLDVGVTSDQTQLASNYLEMWLPAKSRIVACGLDNAGFLTGEYPGIRVVQADGLALPFADNSFDHVHASAVIEHVGSSSQQALFLSELYRVARLSVFVTTPNRWFPIEFHSVLPLVHWLPPRCFRRVLRGLGHHDLAKEANLNLMSSNTLAAACTEAGISRFRVLRMRLLGITSNLALRIYKDASGLPLRRYTEQTRKPVDRRELSQPGRAAVLCGSRDGAQQWN